MRTEIFPIQIPGMRELVSEEESLFNSHHMRQNGVKVNDVAKKHVAKKIL